MDDRIPDINNKHYTIVLHRFSSNALYTYTLKFWVWGKKATHPLSFYTFKSPMVTEMKLFKTKPLPIYKENTESTCLRRGKLSPPCLLVPKVAGSNLPTADEFS